MIHGQRRLLSTFPKKVALPPSRPIPSRDRIEDWAHRQPPPPTALIAFAHRIGLTNSLADPDIIQQVCIHPSFVAFHQSKYHNEPIPPSNGPLASLGNALLGLFATEYVHTKFPHLPTRVVKAVVSAYVGPMTCASVAQEIGASHLLRWDRRTQGIRQDSILRTDALSSIPRALTALIYQEKSLNAARKFAHDLFFSRIVDIRSLIKFRDPKVALVETVAKFGRERPISRLLKETGRLSNTPMFVVGIYSGEDKLGEGFGSSLKMAEFRAAEDSLHRLYLTQHPSELINLPTTTFSSKTLYDSKHSSVSYVPASIGETEVTYGSSGRSGVAVGAGRQRLPGGAVYADEVEEEENDVHKQKRRS
ncbi:hypothetical protein M422DRAFT_219930 [Sphaerobolus stellatus SS14]|nr:hypothetical protein M422DRAFT_219930 [Sphaerobolus stellatus SS14]